MSFAVRRTRPKKSPNTEPITHHNSEPDLSTPKSAEALDKITFRNKRKHDLEYTTELNTLREDIISSLRTLRQKQEEKFNVLQNNLVEIKAQNSDLHSTIQSMSSLYDDLMVKVVQLEKIRKHDLEYIKTLEDRVESLERGTKSSSLEIRNVPKKPGETKSDLINIVKTIGIFVNTQIQAHDIRDVYRLSTKNPQTNGPITAEFTSIITKEIFLTNIKKHNKDNINNRLNTSHINMDSNLPIYISESLTTKARKLFYQAREFTKANDYAYRWISPGKYL